jgi:hypothetical protein
LSRKYKIAKVALKTVQVAFGDLTNAVNDPSWIDEWKQLEAQALEKRGTAMSIYNVSPIKGIACFGSPQQTNKLMTTVSAVVSQAGKRDELLSKTPSKEANEQVQWIWTGMLIELDQYVSPSLQNFG